MGRKGPASVSLTLINMFVGSCFLVNFCIVFTDDKSIGLIYHDLFVKYFLDLLTWVQVKRQIMLLRLRM